MSKEELDGVWRTVRGRRIFIKKGESLGEAMSRSGKFKRSDIREEKTSLRAEDYMNKIKNKSVASKKNQKETDKYYKKTAKKGEYTKFGYEPNANNQVEKNRINENANIEGSGKTRVQRNWNRYSEEQRREVRHEEIQKKLADYKVKKQSNNKVEENIESLSKLSPSELYEYDRGHTYKDSNVADYVRNKTLYQESGLQRHYDAMKEAEKRYKQEKIDKENAKHPQYKGTDYEVKYASVEDAINDPNSAINKYIKEKEKIKSFKAKKQSNTLTRKQMAEALVDDQIKRGVVKQESREKQIQARLTGKFKMSYIELRDYYNEYLKKGK